MPAQTARASTPQPPILLREQIGGIAVLTLNRPEARNSLSEAMIAELHGALNEIRDDKSVRAVVIAANGPAFSAGHDMKELTARRSDPDRGRAYFAQIMNACSAMMQAIVHLPKPVVASVQGIATAAGCQLVASCDLAVASEDAAFATPGGKGGLFCHTPLVAVARNIGRKRALQMALTGDPISAVTAAAWGLINMAVPDDELVEATANLLARATRGSIASKALGKQTFYEQIGLEQEA